MKTEMKVLVHVAVEATDGESAEVKQEFEIDGEALMAPIEIATRAVDLLYAWAHEVVEE